jgi:1,2-phenylacetyl-CoA epoxidase catalytic subunit
LREAVLELWPYALGVLDEELRPRWVERMRAILPFDLPETTPDPRGQHTPELRELWDEMTLVRRAAPDAQW